MVTDCDQTSGLGKTSLIRAITQSCPHVVHVDPTVPIAMASTGLLPTNTLPYDPPMAQGSFRITKTLASTKPYPQWWREPTSISSLSGSDTAGDMVLDRNVCFVDTPGYQETCRVCHPSSYRSLFTTADISAVRYC